jgi:predicted MPP superfamily phosphohydrolase
VARETLAVKGLASELSGFKIAFASDFHRGDLVPAETIRAAVDAINAQKPDVVLLGGDYITEATRYYESAFAELELLSAAHGVYSVPGNHEYWTGIINYTRMISATSIKDLTNRGFEIGSRRRRLWIAGLDDNWCGGPDAVAAVAGAPPDAARVIFAHNPTVADELPAGYADLILAGHTHGWQVYVPGVTRWFLPLESMRRYRAGYYRTNAGLMYVSRGVGVWHIPFRLWARPDIVIFTLVGA